MLQRPTHARSTTDWSGGRRHLLRALALRLVGEQGSALVEFAITLPLLVVFVVGIFDFSGAFNQKQKIAQAAQQAAIMAGSQPMSDIQAISGSNPDSLQSVVTTTFNALAAGGLLPNANQGTCKMPPPAPTLSGLAWTYAINGCSSSSSDQLKIKIDRGWVASAGPPASVGTQVTISYPYHWRFNSVIQFLVPGASYTPTTTMSVKAAVHNQA
jgi:hypothetical protein